jgi:hypothetical protein
MVAWKVTKNFSQTAGCETKARKVIPMVTPMKLVMVGAL